MLRNHWIVCSGIGGFLAPDYAEDLHDRFGGNPQSGIAPCADHPFVFIFSSPKGEEYGYKDGWASNTEYLYTGEGWRGNMEMKRGNKAIRDHEPNGKQLLLFVKVAQNQYKFEGELRYVSHSTQQGEDIDGHLRSIFIFKLQEV